jgi:biotin transport system substrate-specific component
MVLCALFSSLIAICAWISIPIGDIAFTMQTFAVFLTLGILGGKRGTVSILCYLLLGAVGLPVFSGFQGGFGVLLGVSGGFLWGFLLSGLSYWMLERLGKPLAMTLSMLLCYACGCGWFSDYTGGAGLAAVVVKCVVPYLIPDALKIWLAISISNRIGKHIRNV